MSAHRHDAAGWLRQCVPPVRKLQSLMVPPRGDPFWPAVRYQPMLYLGLWVAGLIIAFCGDFTSIPPDGADTAVTHSAYWLWLGLTLVSPPIGLASLWIYDRDNPPWKYRALWLRLAGDLGQLTSMGVYITLRIGLGDYHIYPMVTLCSATLFVFHLILRDLGRISAVEYLAGKIIRNEEG